MSQSGSIVFPVLPLRDIVVFPHMIVPLFVGREKSIHALEEVMKDDKQILLVAQKNAAQDDPGRDDIYRVGTVSSVLQLLKLPDGTVKVLVEGQARARITSFIDNPRFFQVRAELLSDRPSDPREIEALVRAVTGQFEQYIKLNKKVPPEVLVSLQQIDDPSKLADTIAAHLSLKIPDKQELLETTSLAERFERLYGFMEGEISVLQVEKRIRARVKSQMEKTQREYYLNEQMKAIQKELGELEDGKDELGELEERIKKTKLSKEAREKAQAELKKLRSMSPMSAEATVVRNYLDWLLSIPWKKRTKVSTDLKKAQAILDADHYGLEKVKERIIEYLAVQQRVGKKWEIPFDLARARQYLQEAGFPNGFEIESVCVTGRHPLSVELCEAVASQWEASAAQGPVARTTAPAGRDWPLERVTPVALWLWWRRPVTVPWRMVAPNFSAAWPRARV